MVNLIARIDIIESDSFYRDFLVKSVWRLSQDSIEKVPWIRVSRKKKTEVERGARYFL